MVPPLKLIFVGFLYNWYLYIGRAIAHLTLHQYTRDYYCNYKRTIVFIIFTAIAFLSTSTILYESVPTSSLQQLYNTFATTIVFCTNTTFLKVSQQFTVNFRKLHNHQFLGGSLWWVNSSLRDLLHFTTFEIYSFVVLENTELHPGNQILASLCDCPFSSQDLSQVFLSITVTSSSVCDMLKVFSHFNYNFLIFL